VTVSELPVEIDITPGSPPLPIKLNGPPAISVIVRTTATFNAAAIRPATATLGDGNGTDASVSSLKGQVLATLVDVDLDGDRDLVLIFAKSNLLAAEDLSLNTHRLVFRAELQDGRPVRGDDLVQVTR
jgi:hypothetical protein